MSSCDVINDVMSAWNITCTTRHLQQCTCKILFVWHQSFIVKSSGQTSWQTYTHTQTNKHTGWKHYHLAIAGDKNKVTQNYIFIMEIHTALEIMFIWKQCPEGCHYAPVINRHQTDTNIVFSQFSIAISCHIHKFCFCKIDGLVQERRNSVFKTQPKKLSVLLPWSSNHKHKIEEKF